MTDYLTTDSELEAVADAIRAKGATSALLVYPNGFVSAINAIPTGITPTGTKSITISAAGTTTEDVTNYASAEITVPSGSASTPTISITSNPSILVGPTGLITASVSASQSVTPSVSAGYVSSGTAGTVSVSGSNTQQLTAQAAQTITPGTTDQTIASGKYLTGTQTIKGDANLVAANIADGVTIFGVTGTHQGGGGGSTVNAGLVDTIGAVQAIYYVDGNGYHLDMPQLDEDYVPRWSADVSSPSIVAILMMPSGSPDSVSNMTFQTRVSGGPRAPADVLLYSV